MKAELKGYTYSHDYLGHKVHIKGTHRLMVDKKGEVVCGYIIQRELTKNKKP